MTEPAIEDGDEDDLGHGAISIDGIRFDLEADKPTEPAAKCTPATAPPGSELWRRTLGFGATSDVAADVAGNVFHVKLRTRFEGDRYGITKLSPDGAELYARQFGAKVAVDLAGNAYVAGTFDEPLDVGFGPMIPVGGSDVFIAKLSPSGQTLFAKQLGECLDDRAGSIAVDAQGRIAVSGFGIGTLVLDAAGHTLFAKSFGGDVAFDSAGNLVIGGMFGGTLDVGGGVMRADPTFGDGFLVKLDAAGHHVFSFQIGEATLPITNPGGVVFSQLSEQAVSSVAVGPGDTIALAGEFTSHVKLFGTDFTAIIGGENGLIEGGFVVTLDASGDVLFKRAFLAERSHGVTTDVSGNVVFSGAGHVSVPPFLTPMLVKLDATGGTLWGKIEMPASGIGEGYGVAADVCGNVYWAVSARDPETEFRSYLLKFSP